VKQLHSLLFIPLTLMVTLLAACLAEEPTRVDVGGRSAAVMGDVCGEQTVTFFAGQTIDAGTVTISHDADTLYIAIALADGWTMSESHVAVGDSPDDIPHSRGGPVPGRFPFKRDYDPAVSSDVYALSLAELGYDLGPGTCVPRDLVVAVHAALRGPRGNETAWSDGSAFPGRNWATFTTYALTCCEDGGCTLTQGYWKNHTDVWPTDGALCGQSWLESLNTPPAGGNAWFTLAHQWIAATLNRAAGASAPPEVLDALDEAEALLLGCAIAVADRERAVLLGELLDAYNRGVVGPGHCDD
jgi:hypothetical protein